MSKRTKAKQIILGLPIDGTFGTTNIPGVNSTDNPTEALDKIIRVLDLLAPPQSPGLSNRNLSISNSFSGRECFESLNAGNDYPIIIDDASPVANLDGEFSDGDNGNLEVRINSFVDGFRALTTADDTGVYSSLEILSDEDPYLIAPNAGFWKSLTARINCLSVLPADNTEQLFEMEHSVTGLTSLSFKVDENIQIPTISFNANSLDVKAGYNIKYVSGVPGLSVGDVLSCSYTIDNAVSRFYHSNRVGRIEGNNVDAVDIADPLSIPNVNGSMNVEGEVVINNNQLTSNLTLNYYGYNVKNIDGSSFISRGDLNPNQLIFVDTISDESIRVRSGQGAYPAFGVLSNEFGEPYTNAISQEVIGTGNVVEELQMFGGQIVYPAGIYTFNYPVIGPDYSSITGRKWATFKIGTITNETSVTFEILNPYGINEETLGQTVTADMDCNIMVLGETGWLDANLKYISGDPNLNGDPCYDVVGSPNDGITRRCTFGTQTLSGDVYVRIGLPTGSPIKFNNVVKI